ncbi:MAG: XRE family transcriptional regulator [Herbaspirillum sp.]|nr:XRE family transcriptional regulator [Herbaspirillum sp.]
MTEIDTIHSGSNVFSDLGFSPDHAAVMLVRIQIAASILECIRKNGWTPTQAASELDISDQLVSQIVCTELREVSLDTLWMIATRSGLDLELKLSEKD